MLGAESQENQSDREARALEKEASGMQWWSETFQKKKLPPEQGKWKS